MLLWSFVESVSYSKLVGDVVLFALSRLVANLSANVCHIHLQFFDTSFFGGIPPNRFENRHICHHLAAVFGKKRYNIIFRLGEFNRFAFNIYLSGIIIDL